jgi:hypothetical protein
MAEKKTVKMYTTKAGAQQYGSEEDAKKHAKRAFRAFLKNPTQKNLRLVEQFDAAKYAAIAKETREKFGKDSGHIYDAIEKSNLTAAQQTKARSLLKLK